MKVGRRRRLSPSPNGCATGKFFTPVQIPQRHRHILTNEAVIEVEFVLRL